MGRIVVITGGTSGIGLALKQLFEKNGDTVLTFSLDETGDANHYCGSVSHEIKVRQVFNDIHERFGTIDILINNAGCGLSGITELVPLDEIYKVMDVNFYGTVYCTRSALPHMNAGAKIINMSSAMALFPVPFRGMYGAAKSAVLNFSHSLRMELAPLGIDVTAICPGDTKTNFTANRAKDMATTERYGARLKTATESSDAREEKRMSCEYVAEKIFKHINAKKLKPFYIIGGKYKFLYFLTRFTPKSLLLACTAKKLGGTFEEGKKKNKAVKIEMKKDVLEQTEETLVKPTADEKEESVELEAQETTQEQNVVEETAQEDTTTANAEDKPKINDILSRISIINKPDEPEKETDEESDTEE